MGDENKPEAQAVGTAPVTKSVSSMDLNETSKVLDERIKQLQRDQMELESLKCEVNRKLQQ